MLFVIDDDIGVVHALQEDLGRRFGEDFRVIGESSAVAGLAMLRKLAHERRFPWGDPGGRWAATPLPTVLQAAVQELGQVGAGDVGELVELGAAGEPVGQHHRVLGVAHGGQQGGLGDGP